MKYSNENNFNIPSIILAGGFGTRLRKVSHDRPKSLMPLGDKLFIDFLIERLIKNKINQIFISLHYKSELFIEHINKMDYGIDIVPIIEPKPLGTGGAISFVLRNTEIHTPFFVINGDTLSDIALENMYHKFKNSHLYAMIGLSFIKNASRYGIIKEKNNIIYSFSEKSNFGRGWINNGYYIFKKELFQNQIGKFSLELDLFPKIIRKSKLGFFKVDNDRFLDIGTPSDYKKFKNFIKDEK